MQYILSMRQGNASKTEFQHLVADIYTAAATDTVSLLLEAFRKVDALDKNVRFALQEKNCNDVTLSNSARPVGEEIQFHLELNFQPYELIFAMPEYAAGTNRLIIGHVLCIDGDYRIYAPFDPRIMRRAKNNLHNIWGIDLYATEGDDGVTIKEFLSRDVIGHVLNSSSTPGERSNGFVNSILIHQLTAKARKQHHDYTLSDLVRVTVGCNPVMVKVDSTATSEEE